MQRLWLIALFAAGCPSSDPPQCLDEVNTDCAELYEPTFANVYTRTLQGTCGSTRVSCHSPEGMQGGMNFGTQDSAFSALRAGRVAPGDPKCSKMIVRVSSPGADYEMPPGSVLSDAERCSLVKWVQNGALP